MTELIKKILVTEKSSAQQERNTYTLLVDPAATKNEIKKAVKELYKVDALRVRTVTQQPVRRRYRGQLVLKKSPKKAFVTVKAGQKIEIA